AVVRRVVGNPLRIGVAEGLHTEGVPAVIGCTDNVIRAWIEAEDRLLTVIREVVDVLSGIVGDPGRLVTHGNDSWLNLGDVRRADDVAAERHLPDVRAFEMGDAADGLLDLSVSDHDRVLPREVCEAGWVRARLVPCPGIDRVDQRRAERACRGSDGRGQRKLHDLAESL